jgi:hypothetical protein
VINASGRSFYLITNSCIPEAANRGSVTLSDLLRPTSGAAAFETGIVLSMNVNLDWMIKKAPAMTTMKLHSASLRSRVTPV